MDIGGFLEKGKNLVTGKLNRVQLKRGKASSQQRRKETRITSYTKRSFSIQEEAIADSRQLTWLKGELLCSYKRQGTGEERDIYSQG